MQARRGPHVRRGHRESGGRHPPLSQVLPRDGEEDPHDPARWATRRRDRRNPGSCPCRLVAGSQIRPAFSGLPRFPRPVHELRESGLETSFDMILRRGRCLWIPHWKPPHPGAYNPLGVPMRIKVVLETSEEGGYTVFVPSLPGCISEGETVKDALKNIREAIALYLDPVPDDLAGRRGREIREVVL